MSKTIKLAVLKGDGIGPEVVDATLRVLDAVQDSVKGLEIKYEFADAGYYCIAKYGTNLPRETIEVLKKTDCVLKGPMTTPEEEGAPPSVAVQIRKLFDLYANIRPAKVYPRTNPIREDIDLVIVRENTEGLYAGIELKLPDAAVAMRVITKKGSERIGRIALELAKNRKKHLTIVHKANILRLTDGLFKNTIYEIAKKDFPEVQVDDAHIDIMTANLIKRPHEYDVVVAENMFGDILSDEAAHVAGGIGLAAAANIGENYAMFEPVHGSAPKYTGKNVVNPIATILSMKMMFEWFKLNSVANLIDNAVIEVLKEGKTLTYDLGGSAKTYEVADSIAKKVGELANLIKL
ncbi:MAG TPA: isocitrate/isopropylmalate dehydrogenase family protein [Geobacterales bacterium]|nr:isocitrate/isopropylmalate dehydrogenase family protein [Geobacterales bacterium]